MKNKVKAQLKRTEADIVFCIDATASMQASIEGVKDGLASFVEGLNTAASVDFRLRLIAYRDLHDPACTVPFDVFGFVDVIDSFKRCLETVEAKCNQEHRSGESALDALYIALHSDWRLSKCHKTVVLVTDDDTHPTLHHTTYNRQDNTVSRVIQDFQELSHAMLFIVAPMYPTYEKIAAAMKYADRKIIAKWVSLDEDGRCTKLADIQWSDLMRFIGKEVSKTSLVCK